MNINKSKAELYLSPILNIILGIVLIIFKGDVIRWAALAIGVFVVVLACIDLFLDFKSDSSTGIIIDVVRILVGALVIIFAGAFAQAIRIIAGILFLIYGIIRATLIKEALLPITKTILLVEAILYVVVGILLFLDKEVLYYVLGAILIFNGIIDILYSKDMASRINDSEANKHKDAIDVEVKDFNK
jgi:uncharacterized membrane protein HdeD (DUF308 family)